VETIINEIIKKSKKKFNGISTFMDDYSSFSDVDLWISTNIPDLHIMLNTPGIPNCVMEISGQSQAGKTTMGLNILNSVLKQKGISIIAKTERRMNAEYASKIITAVNSVIIKKLLTIEDVFQYIHDQTLLIRGNTIEMPIVFLWDSLGATPSEAEKESKNGMADAARVIHQELRKMMMFLEEQRVTVIVINQRYQKIGMVFGKKTESRGGQGIRFHSGIRLEVAKGAGIKVNDEVIAQYTNVEVLKNDYGPPHVKAKVPLVFGVGYVPNPNLFPIAIESGLLKKNGAHGFTFTRVPSFSWTSQDKYYLACKKYPFFAKFFSKMLTDVVNGIIIKNHKMVMGKLQK